MQNSCSYGFGKTVELDYERALDKLLGLFRARDFHILFQVDMQEALRQESGAGFRRYMIIGACPQALARRAFNADSNIGLLLPWRSRLQQSRLLHRLPGDDAQRRPHSSNCGDGFHIHWNNAHLDWAQARSSC
jgi:hypothetical protein